jgi:hypothetical protein
MFSPSCWVIANEMESTGDPITPTHYCDELQYQSPESLLFDRKPGLRDIKKAQPVKAGLF